MARSGLMRLSNFSRRSGSMAASSRTSLSRVFHFAYLLKPMPIARRAEMIQTLMSVAVTESIKKRKGKRRPQEKLFFLFGTEFKLQARKAAINLTFLRRVGDFLVRVHRGTIAVLCTKIGLFLIISRWTCDYGHIV